MVNMINTTTQSRSANPAGGTGNWNLGTDVYGNLVFTNGSTLFNFGLNGNVSHNRHSLQTAGGAAWPAGSIVSDGALQVDNWTIGVDTNGDLRFVNQTNTNTVVMSNSGSSMGVNGVTSSFGQMPNAPTSALMAAGSVALFSQGQWNVYMDVNNNLCFTNDNGYYMVRADGVYSNNSAASLVLPIQPSAGTQDIVTSPHLSAVA